MRDLEHRLDVGVLDRALRDQPIHRHRPGLPDPMRAVGGLVLGRGVPPGVHVDHVVGRGQVQALPAGLERDEEHVPLAALEGVHPLYTVEDAQEALSFFDGQPYRHSVSIGKEMTCTLYDAGHILGSAFALIRAWDNGRNFTIGFSGDMGRFDKPIIEDPTLNFDEQDLEVDLLIMESTYGDRLHEPVVDLKPKLKQVLVDTYDRGGTILIPSFAFGRTQELLYVLHELYNANEVPRFPVYVDSPLATKITRVFAEHPEVYDQETHQAFLQQGENPFQFDQVNFVGSVEESMALNRDERPHIVVSASGMCEAGRILHHLRYKIHNSKNLLKDKVLSMSIQICLFWLRLI